MPVYLFFLLGFFFAPLTLLMLFHKKARGIFRYKRSLLWTLFFIYTLGLLWDWISVRTGVWRYDAKPTLGLWFFGIPVEELLGFYTAGTLLMLAVIEGLLMRHQIKKGGERRK